MPVTLRCREFIVIRDSIIKKKLRQASVNQKFIEGAPLFIVVCSNTSRSVGRYGQFGRDFYSIIDGAFVSILILLTAVNELPILTFISSSPVYGRGR